MSRSKHTRPDHIVAAARVRAPFESRGKNDQSSFRQLARFFKESGIVLDLPETNADESARMPRILVNKPRQGFMHPADKKDVVRVLQFFGETCFYGLRSIRLVQGTTNLKEGHLSLGRLEVPGSILLFDQPIPPWFINGTITGSERKRLEKAGASVEAVGEGTHCLIHWGASELKNFMLFDVLMHEIGHHIIQQYKGKRNVRVVRTKDHELFAALFAERCRNSFLSARDEAEESKDGEFDS